MPPKGYEIEILSSVSDLRSPAPAPRRGGLTAPARGENAHQEQIFFLHMRLCESGYIDQVQYCRNDDFQAQPFSTSHFHFRCTGFKGAPAPRAPS